VRVRLEIVVVAARLERILERCEGDGQVDGTPDDLAPRALGRPGIGGGGEHVFARLGKASDGTGVRARRLASRGA
jgi:hypothetical protein